jgi:hypothetical protein
MRHHSAKARFAKSGKNDDHLFTIGNNSVSGQETMNATKDCISRAVNAE